MPTTWHDHLLRDDFDPANMNPTWHEHLLRHDLYEEPPCNPTDNPTEAPTMPTWHDDPFDFSAGAPPEPTNRRERREAQKAARTERQRQESEALRLRFAWEHYKEELFHGPWG